MISICIATYGSAEWAELAEYRAYPSAISQGAHEVIVEHQHDGDIATCRNAAAARATGDWLVFLDADDELAPGYIAAMEAAARPHSLLVPRAQKVIRKAKRTPVFYSETDLLSSNWLVIGTALERSLFIQTGGFVVYPHGFEDWALWFKCAKLGAQVVKVPAAIYQVHVNVFSAKYEIWRNAPLQVATHNQVKAELEAWVP